MTQHNLRLIIEQVLSRDLSAIWTVLNGQEKRRIMDHFELRDCGRGEVIYREGDDPERIWCLLRGKVKLYKDGVSGRPQILRLLQPVQYFGYRAYFAHEPYVSSTATIEPSTLGSLPMSLVNDMIDHNKDLAWFFIRELSRTLGGSDTRIVNLTQKRLRARLAETLCVLRDSYGYEGPGDNTLRIYMSREDLANLSNMTTSNAIRTLSEFADERLIVIDGRRLRLINEEGLRRISRNG